MTLPRATGFAAAQQPCGLEHELRLKVCTGLIPATTSCFEAVEAELRALDREWAS